MDENLMFPLFLVGGAGGRGQWLQMTSALALRVAISGVYDSFDQNSKTKSCNANLVILNFFYLFAGSVAQPFP